MRRPALGTALLLASLAPTAPGAGVVVDGRAFSVPDGFTVERAAGPPMVDRPIVADFDERGRLYVADSSGSNDNVNKQVIDRPHRIVRLEDSDGDGKFDRSTVFADRMMFPEGAMWLDGSLYVAAPPSIWKLTDVDGDGVADRREEWFQGKTLTGCANDLHGPYAGPDGRVYWCKGAFAPQTYDRPGGKPLVTRAAHIFRAKPDGTGIEPVMTGGMDNPVDVAFTAEGDRIFTTTFFQHPGDGKRDGLIHALYGGVYGKVHDVIDGHPRTGPDVLPPMVHLGPAAPAGLARAESDALGCRDDLFAACFNLRKVTRHRLAPLGATYTASTEDFLASEDHDFHPTDVIEDADGSLLVVDTGGWYKICCPTSQLVKPDVLGGIYRVRRKDAPRVADPRGLKLDWAAMGPEALADLLDDPRPAVRRRAVAGLAAKGEAAVRVLSLAIPDGRSAEVRRNAVWAASRIESAEIREGLTWLGLSNQDQSVRRVAIHSAGLWRSKLTSPLLTLELKGPSIANCRAAAEALGRIGDPSAVPALLDAAGAATDAALRHSLTYALIEIGDPGATSAGLSHASPLARRAAMIALDQMEGGTIGFDQVRPELDSTDRESRDAAWWIAGHHPDWGDRLAGFLRDRLAVAGLSTADRAELEGRIAGLARVEAIRAMIADRLADPAASADSRLALLRAMARSGVKEVPPGWIAALTKALGDDATAPQAVATARALAIRPEGSGDLAPALRKLAGRAGLPADVRLGALAAVPGGLDAVDPDSFAFLLGRLGPDRPISDRSTAADVLAKARPTPDQFARLADAVAGAGPIELGRLLEAFDRAEGDEVGRRLVDALGRSPARSSLDLPKLRARLARFGPAVRPPAEALSASIEADTADRRGRLETLLGSLSGGDVRRGQAIFNGPKAACATCHAIGYVGGKLGPDLTKIGQVRAERDLLESIAFPGASFVRSYEPVAVATRQGRVFSGILRRDAPDEIVLAVAADKEERIARDDVEEVRPGTVSVMPEGLDRQLTPGELADLIAFLKSCR